MHADTIADRTGQVWAHLRWGGPRLDHLERLDVEGVTVLGAVVDDPLLGPAHDVRAGEALVTRMSALDWARPVEIPAIAAPGRLPAGAGGAILNVLAILAARAGVPALRYAGPYPTAALWRTLARSFRTTGTEHDFTRDAVTRMATLARDPIAIDFVPAPHERVAIPAHGHAEVRDGVERVVLDRVAYEPAGSPARLVREAGDVRAEIWFGDRVWAHVATLTEDGTLVDGPHPIPPCTSDVIGKPFPPPLVAAIAELVAELVPPPLGDGARTWLEARSVRWADLGATAARATGDGVAVHAAIWQRVGPLGAARLALALAEALAPVVTSALVGELARHASERPHPA